MAHNKQSIVVEYLEIHDKYVKQFGEHRTFVLMQAGKFYEAYSTYIPESKIGRGPDLFKIEKITDAAIARKGTDPSISHPYMWGFPMNSASKYMPLLIEHGYNLIVYEQVTPPPNVKRELVNIYSKATYIETVNKSTSNFIANIFIEEIIQQDNRSICNVGLSAIDVSTGEVLVHESYSDVTDENLGLDEAVRFLHSLNPQEYLIDCKFDTQNKIREKNIIEYFDLRGKIYRFREYNKDHGKLQYQRKLFELLYSEQKGITDILDNLGISRAHYARNSLATLLTYLSDHYDKLVTGIKVPKFYFGNQTMILGNDAIIQLDIIGSERAKNTESKIQNLIDIIDKTLTNMGKRYLNMKLSSPIIDPVELNKTYDIVEYMMKKSIYIELEGHLKGIFDIERLERKMSLKMLNPSEFVNFAKSFDNVLCLFNIIKTKNYLTKYIRTSHLRKKINTMNNMITKEFDLDKCKLYSNRTDIQENIFKRNVYPDLDEIQNKIGMSHDLMEDLQKVLEGYINENTDNNDSQNSNQYNNRKELITLKNNQNDGYYFHITKKRYEKLKSVLDSIGEHIEVGDNKINVSELKYKELKNAVKISAPFLEKSTENIEELLEKMRTLTFERFVMKINNIYAEFAWVIKESVEIITMIDYYYCISKVSRINNYVRPIIKNTTNNNSEDNNDNKLNDNDNDVDDNLENDNMNESFVKAEGLRHPIVEHLIDHEYIPHDVDIGTDLKGILLYGLNAAGKSVLMKAIGMSIIMAQSGFFVPAKNYTYYPYNALYTRITGNDNIFRGLSSFSYEMVELAAIFKRADARTLVIGDEVCRSTEHVSGNAIVASTLMKLNQLKSTFVFATHLHELMDLDIIKNMKSVKAYHLSVSIDPKTNELIYDRKMKPGSGERIYGIVVAKSIIKDTEFIKNALAIKNVLLDNDPDMPIISGKKSRYNSSIYIDRCRICGMKNTFANPTPLEIHHINPQAECENGFVKSKPHIKKNSLANLTEICRKCHDSVHNGDISIEGYCMSSSGKKMIIKNDPSLNLN